MFGGQLRIMHVGGCTCLFSRYSMQHVCGRMRVFLGRIDLHHERDCIFLDVGANYKCGRVLPKQVHICSLLLFVCLRWFSSRTSSN